MKIKSKQFLTIPDFILFNKELDCADKMILADIYSLSQLPKGCYKSQNGFASFVNLDRSTISQKLENLRVNGFISSTKIRPELKNSRKKYELIIDKFFQEELVEESTRLVDSPTTNSVPVNYQLVDPLTTSSLPANIYNDNTNTIYNDNILEQNNTNKNNFFNCSGVSLAQHARNNINLLEDKIINASVNGWLIVQNASYVTIKNLYDYVDNKKEYELVFPLLKNLVNEKKKLNG